MKHINREETLAKLEDRITWIIAHVSVTLQELKDAGILEGGYEAHPDLPSIVEEAREKYGHENPSQDEVERALAALQGSLE